MPDEHIGELVELQEVHQAVSVGLSRQDSIALTRVEQVGQEVLRFLALLHIILVVAAVGYELRQGVSSQITIDSLLRVVLESHQVAGERVDTVALLRGDTALLQVSQKLDARPVVLNDTIDDGEGPPNNLLVVGDCAHDVHERLDCLLGLILVLTRIKEVPLRGRVHLHEALDEIAVIGIEGRESFYAPKRSPEISKMS